MTAMARRLEDEFKYFKHDLKCIWDAKGSTPWSNAVHCLLEIPCMFLVLMVVYIITTPLAAVGIPRR